MRRRPIRIGYQLERGRITYWLDRECTTLMQARYWARRMNGLPGIWVVRA